VDKWRGRLLSVELGVELFSSSAGSSSEAAALCWTTGGAVGIPARGARGGGRE